MIAIMRVCLCVCVCEVRLGTYECGAAGRSMCSVTTGLYKSVLSPITNNLGSHTVQRQTRTSNCLFKTGQQQLLALNIPTTFRAS